MSDSYSVTVVFEFSYGHRIVGHEGKCKHLHGHNGKVEVTYTSTQLNELGMVVDFGVVKKALKSWVDEALDHKMILSVADPLYHVLEAQGEPLFSTIVPPTAEVFAEMILRIAQNLAPRDVKAHSVKFWETSTSFAVVYA